MQLKNRTSIDSWLRDKYQIKKKIMKEKMMMIMMMMINSKIMDFNINLMINKKKMKNHMIIMKSKMDYLNIDSSNNNSTSYLISKLISGRISSLVIHS